MSAETVTRRIFLTAVEDDDRTSFLQLIERNNSKTDPFDVGELLAIFSKKEQEDLWEHLVRKCTAVLLSLDPEEEEDQQQQDMQHTQAVLQAVITVANAAMSQKEVYVPEPMLETLTVLHGVLLALPTERDKVKNNISKLCETWWIQNLPGRDSLMQNTLLYLLQKNLEKKASVTDIKRLNSIRKCLQQMNIEDEKHETLRELLLKCFMSSQVVKLEEGRRFLSFLFSLRPTFIEAIHKTIKSQLPHCSKTLVEFYGEIYFRAWRVASSPFLQEIEERCIQDLMYHAVHARRDPPMALASTLRKTLGYFHKQKKQKGVDEMLLRLYEPILWRSLRVANGLVRANALALLADAFPLHDPDANVGDVDSMMQKQFDILGDLLFDPCPMVRATAAHGVSRICNVFWELMPPQTIRSFIQILVKDLSRDSSSADVRVAVLQGLTYLLDNHLSHPVLNTVLPDVKDMLHDTSEKVRVAFLDLLLKVKGIRAIKFWAIVPMEHLLVRLEIDGTPVCKRIVNLIFNSFMPVEKSADVQLTRCTTLIQMNSRAARKFYQYAAKHLSVKETCDYIILLCRVMMHCVRKERDPNSEESQSQSVDEEEKENEGDEDSDLTVENTEEITGMLEAMAILWTSIGHQLQQRKNAPMKQKLEKGFSRALPQFFRAFNDDRIHACLLLLAGFLPPAFIPTLSRSAVSKLRAMTHQNTPEEYGALVECMCKWGRVEDLIELIEDWLMAGLEPKQQEQTHSSNKQQKKARGVQFVDPVEPQPMLALDYIVYLTKQPVCRESILLKSRGSFRALTEILRKVLPNIEQRMLSNGSLGLYTSDEFLQRAFEIYCKMEVLLHDAENKENDAITAFEHLLTWMDIELVSALRNNDVNGPDQGVKRSAMESEEAGVLVLASQLIQTLLRVSSDMLLVGVGDQELASHLADLALQLTQCEENSQFLVPITKLMYQITEFSVSYSRENDEGVGSQSDVVPGMLAKVVQLLANIVQSRKEQAKQILSSVKPAVSEMLRSYYKHYSLHDSVNRDIMATVMAAVVAEMTNTIHQDFDFKPQDHIQNLPTLSSFFLGIICKTSSMTGWFLAELCQCTKAGAVQGREGMLGTVHILHTICKSKAKGAELKDCLSVAQLQFEKFEEPSEEREREMHTLTHNLLKDCMKEVGMVTGS